MKKIFSQLVCWVAALLLALAACAEIAPTTPSLPLSPLTATLANVLQPTETDIPTPTLGVGSAIVSEKDGATLLPVPQGEFSMGSNERISNSYDVLPKHSVTLDAFWVDQTEVTNQQYALCVADGTCKLPTNVKSPTRSSYYGDPKFSYYPVIYVDWAMAKTYCEWAGRRLPTEAEWEKAARGEQAFIYPWGNDVPNDTLLNFNSSTRDTTEVGKYPDGKSVYGAYDMAGNVWEWVGDWYSENYYQSSPSSNPAGPASGDFGGRVLRGGSWYFEDGSLRSIFRFGVIPVETLVRADLRSWLVPDYSDTSIYGKPPLGLGTVGFRCALSQ
jgi:formylglycine-generating enzyme required for sulfatase activity